MDIAYHSDDSVVGCGHTKSADVKNDGNDESLPLMVRISTNSVAIQFEKVYFLTYASSQPTTFKTCGISPDGNTIVAIT